VNRRSLSAIGPSNRRPSEPRLAEHAIEEIRARLEDPREPAVVVTFDAVAGFDEIDEVGLPSRDGSRQSPASFTSAATSFGLRSTSGTLARRCFFLQADAVDDARRA
jgi:hypothetical protein